MTLASLPAFLIAIGVLVAVHEWGHYRMALACGVRVLRLSIGFGPALWVYTSRKTGIEYALGVFPLGGYVRMLDEREGNVPVELVPQAFNRQSLQKRSLIVAAGPLANLGLAVLLYSALNWWGYVQSAPVLSTPVPGSLAAQAGLHAGDRVSAADWGDGDMVSVHSFEDLRWGMTRAALSSRDITLQLDNGTRSYRLPLSTLGSKDAGPALMSAVGIAAPFAQPIVGDLVPGDVAERSGLRSGDRVLQVDHEPVSDAADLRWRIRAAVSASASGDQQWLVERGIERVVVRVSPRVVLEGNVSIGRIGAAIGGQVEQVLVRHGLVDGLARAMERTGEISALSLRMLGRMLLGEASLKNLSGPISVAEYAGKSASGGWVPFVLFLALVSISLGVLNLLPVPMLDGGHLMYYLWEWVSGAAPSERWVDGLQRVGVAVLMAMMGLAVWNDVSRLLQ